MFAKTTNNEMQGKKHSKTGIRRTLVALALAGSLGTIALATSAAASASTVTLGPGGITMNAARCRGHITVASLAAAP
jgi:hypothetical protein